MSACGFPGPPVQDGSGGTGGGAAGSSGTGGTAGSTGGSAGSTGGSMAGSGGSSGGCTGVEQNGACLDPPLDGAFLWLRSDAGLAADAAKLSWKDQISGLDAIAVDTGMVADSIPTIVAGSGNFNGQPVVHFDGSPNRRIHLPDVDAKFGAGFTVAIVFRSVAAHSNDGLLFLGVQKSADSWGDAIVVGREQDWDRIQYTVQDSYDPNAWWDGILKSYGGITTLSDMAEILVVTQRPDDATVWLHHDGMLVPKFVGDAPLPPDAARSDSYVGWAPGGAFQGDIAEVLLYNRAVSEPERAALESYLAAKFGVSLASPCAADCPEVLASYQGLPSSLTSNGNRIAWSNKEGGQVMTIEDATAQTVSPPVAVVAPGPTSAQPWVPALDATDVYWGDQSNIYRTPIAGGPSEPRNAGGLVHNVAVDGTNAYAACDKLGWISQSAWDAVTLVDMGEVVTYVAVDEAHVYWTQWAGNEHGGVYRAPKGQLDPASREKVMTGADPTIVALDANAVYTAFDRLGLYGTPTIQRVNKAAPGAAKILAQGGEYSGIALDGDYLYYTESKLGKVLRVPVAGGQSTEVLSGLSRPLGITVVGNYLVWANADGTIVRYPKPTP